MELIGYLLAGIICGYVVNYIADVLPYQRKLGTVICFQCQEKISWQDYLLFRPCTHCQDQTKARRIIVTVLSASIGLWLSIAPPDNIAPIWAFIILTYLGVIVVIDIEHKLILHSTSIPGVVIGLVFGLIYYGPKETIYGGVAGYAIMLVFYLLGGFFLKMINRHREEVVDEVPLGFGDVNLAGVIGLILGFPGVFTGLIIAIFSAGFVSMIVYIAALVQRKNTAMLVIPYGPFLTLGVWLAILI